MDSLTLSSLKALVQVSRALARANSLKDALQEVVNNAAELTGALNCAVIKQDCDDSTMKILVEYSADPQTKLGERSYLADRSLTFDESWLNCQINQNKDLNRADLPSWLKAYLSELKCPSSIFLALEIEDVFSGLLCVHTDGSTDSTRPQIGEVLKALAKETEIALSANNHLSVVSLSHQLAAERLSRHLSAKIFSTLDRDTLLQIAADSVGNALKASACLLVRNADPAPLVTHEWVSPDISPLGLGPTQQLSGKSLQMLNAKIISINDLLDKEETKRYDQTGIEALLSSGARAIIGCSLQRSPNNPDLILIQSDHPRRWTKQELAFVEGIGVVISKALQNAQAYQELKDQVFNLNLLSSLAQQLAGTIDQTWKMSHVKEKPEPPPMESANNPLSAREMEVLRLIASGLANREIAQRLFLTESTVELHASRIRKKLKLKSRTALVKFACDNRLV